MFEIIDNAIPEYLQDFFELIILGKSDKKRVKPLVNFNVKYENTFHEYDQMPLSFVHILKSEHILSDHFANFFQIVDIACKGLKLKLKNVVTGRIYLTTPQKVVKDYCDPHIDLDIDHLVLLYYVNNADGDTVFFTPDGIIADKVEPRKGRLVIFDGAIYHAAGIPKMHNRCVVNFDLVVIK